MDLLSPKVDSSMLSDKTPRFESGPSDLHFPIKTSMTSEAQKAAETSERQRGLPELGHKSNANILQTTLGNPLKGYEYLLSLGLTPHTAESTSTLPKCPKRSLPV